MRKLIFVSTLMLFSVIGTQAQEVYTEVMKLSKKIANNESNSIEMRKIATFQVDALDYMAMKTKQLMPDSPMLVLDKQALAMYEFVNLFEKRLTATNNKKKERQQAVDLFKQASISCPRFNDSDTQLVLSYYNNSNYLTQFSLDTDWEKALDYVREKGRR